jgi:putative NIF3 family GTP cyclohydrolase 1 type 2
LYSGKKDVYKVYIVGGDGKDYIQNAINFGADTLLTGRASYNTMIDAEDIGINIVEAGHFYTENPVCKTLESLIKHFIPNATTEIFNSNKIQVLK